MIKIPIRFFLILFVCSLGPLSFSQSTYITNDRSIDILESLFIKYGTPKFCHSSIRPYKREDAVNFILDIYNSDTTLSQNELRNIQYLINENDEIYSDRLSVLEDQQLPSESSSTSKVYEDSTRLFYSLQENNDEKEILIPKRRKPILKYFYQSPANFFEFDTEDFSFRLNPILNIRYGADLEENDSKIFRNTRGIEVRGRIDKKLYFYTNLLENQGSFNDYINENIENKFFIPGQGNYKPFSSSVIDGLDGYDFPNSQAYVGYKMTEHIEIELGHGRHFIGNGYQSLILSDYAQNYFYLKFNTKIWKLHYQNLFAELAPVSATQNAGDHILPKKYMANHYLSIKPINNLEIGLFETVLFSRANYFEFQYLNPVILYRTVEFFLDSPDNVLIGLNANYQPFSNASIYGQLIIDEFKLDEILNGTGWWANKYGYQLGLKYYNAFGVENLNAQIEYNQVRPYTYSHRDTLDGFNTSVANYSHYNQPLAHPLGSNFKEIILLVNYRLTNKMSAQARFLKAKHGEDDGAVWGGDILKPASFDIVNNYGNFIGQGIGSDISQFGLDLSYEIFHGYSIDVNYLYRKKDSAEQSRDINTQYIGMGIRANVSKLKLDY